MNFKFLNFLKVVFTPLVIFYTFLAAYRYLSQSTGGDETLFLADLRLIQESGWLIAIEKNISIPYLILVYPFSLVFENYIALRLTNILLLIGFFIYLYKYHYKSGSLLFLYLFFYIGAVAFFYSGTNDSLFSISLSIFLIECYKAGHKTKVNSSIALSALVIAFFTRELFIVYAPVILLGAYFLIKYDPFVYRNLKLPVVLFSVFFILNIPSIITNGQLSFDKKSPPSSVQATWTQRQYLAQLMVNSGEIRFHSHPSWEETDTYLRKNGENSLPATTLEGMTMDVTMTVKEFFKDFFYIVIYHSRILGFILVISILISLKSFITKPELKPSYFPIISVGIMTIIFSLIIISYIEMRWLAPVFILAIVYYADLEKQGRIPMIPRSLNLLFLVALTIYGTYGLWGKMF